MCRVVFTFGGGKHHLALRIKALPVFSPFLLRYRQQGPTDRAYWTVTGSMRNPQVYEKFRNTFVQIVSATYSMSPEGLWTGLFFFLVLLYFGPGSAFC